MRLIDADDLYVRLAFLFDMVADGAVKKLSTNDVLEFVKEQPTVDPVKYGRWEDCSNGWMCSVCKHDARKDYPYCPYCGAKMDGDENG